jgi:hypothetical protein
VLGHPLCRALYYTSRTPFPASSKPFCVGSPRGGVISCRAEYVLTPSEIAQQVSPDARYTDTNRCDPLEMRFPCARCSLVPLVPLHSSSIPGMGVLSPHRHPVCFNLPSSLPLENLMPMSVPPAFPRAPTCGKSTSSLLASSQRLLNKCDSLGFPDCLGRAKQDAHPFSPMAHP